MSTFREMFRECCSLMMYQDTEIARKLHRFFKENISVEASKVLMRYSFN